MAKEAVDAAVKTCNLQPKSECQTDGLLLEGAEGWTPNMYIRLVQDYGLESQVSLCILVVEWSFIFPPVTVNLMLVLFITKIKY